MNAPTIRCIVCLTPVNKPWHPLCRSCYAWHLARLHLRRYVQLARMIREACHA